MTMQAELVVAAPRRGHPHHWILNDAGLGRCNVGSCRATKQFTNTFEGPNWHDKAQPSNASVLSSFGVTLKPITIEDPDGE